MIGVTPGMASMARNGSPNAPGNWRTSARENEDTAGANRSPATVISRSSGAAAAFVVFGWGLSDVGAVDESVPPATLEAPAAASGLAVSTGGGSTNDTANRTMDDTG